MQRNSSDHSAPRESLCEIKSAFTPTSLGVSVNALYYASLVIALCGALGGIMAKQWVREYRAGLGNSFSLRERVQRREIRLKGLERYKLALIVELIPLILFLGLLVFLAGLITDLSAKHVAIWIPSVIIVGVSLSALSASIIHGSSNPYSPYRSPLTRLLGRILFSPLLVRHSREGVTAVSSFPKVWKTRTLKHAVNYNLRRAPEAVLETSELALCQQDNPHHYLENILVDSRSAPQEELRLAALRIAALHMHPCLMTTFSQDDKDQTFTDYVLYVAESPTDPRHYIMDIIWALHRIQLAPGTQFDQAMSSLRHLMEDPVEMRFVVETVVRRFHELNEPSGGRDQLVELAVRQSVLDQKLTWLLNAIVGQQVEWTSHRLFHLGFVVDDWKDLFDLAEIEALIPDGYYPGNMLPLAEFPAALAKLWCACVSHAELTEEGLAALNESGVLSSVRAFIARVQGRGAEEAEELAIALEERVCGLLPINASPDAVAENVEDTQGAGSEATKDRGYKLEIRRRELTSIFGALQVAPNRQWSRARRPELSVGEAITKPVICAAVAPALLLDCGVEVPYGSWGDSKPIVEDDFPQTHSVSTIPRLRAWAEKLPQWFNIRRGQEIRPQDEEKQDSAERADPNLSDGTE